MLMDSSFDMQSEIMQDAGESFAQGEGSGFVVGTGFKQPEGFTVNADVLANARTSAVSATIGFDDMMNLTGDLKTGYNPVYVLNRTTLAFLRTLKGGDGHPLWMPGMNGMVMNTINGFPYLIANDMPDIASGSISVAFGDFARGYTIVDRTGMSVVRDEFTQKKLAIVEFTLNRWNTGQVVVPEAIKLLQTKA
jgi:HK97 family phage major capsid protein